MKVEVRPIETQKWHGKEKEESFKRPQKLPALLDGDTLTYATGLSEKDINYLKDEKGVNYQLDNNYDPETPHPFWDSTLPVVKLENNTMFFDTDIPIEFIKVKIMKASKFVANSQKDLDEGLYPEATHVIHDESEEVEIKASKIAITNQAVIECSKLSSEKKAEIILIIDGKMLKGKSPETITVAMDRVIKEKPSEVLRYIGMDKKQVALEALVIECVEKNILQEKGHKIMYHDSVLGVDTTDVVEYLQLDENQDLKLRLMKAITE